MSGCSSYEGTVSSGGMDRVTDSREKSRIGIFGTTQSYAGSSGRVTHELARQGGCTAEQGHELVGGIDGMEEFVNCFCDQVSILDSM